MNKKDLLLKIREIDEDAVELASKYNSLKKKIAKLKKNIEKKTKKDKNLNSAIYIKKPVKPELLEFMNKYKDNDCELFTLVSKHDVQKSISKYIKDTNLQLEKPKRKYFMTNDLLHDLLGLEYNVEYSFLDLNKFIPKMFVK